MLSKIMEIISIIFEVSKPWLMFVGFIYVCLKMIDWARNRKAGAIAFGVIVQFLLPDPKAEVTIKAVAERKQEVKKQQAGDGQPKDNNDQV
jgi:hypothetical protein